MTSNKNKQLDLLANFLALTWAPVGLASDGRGNSLPLKSRLATHYSIGGAIQKLFPQSAHTIASAFSVTLDALEYRCVMTWEEESGRTLEDVLDLIEKVRVAQDLGILPALAKITANASFSQTYQNARRQLIAAIERRECGQMERAA